MTDPYATLMLIKQYAWHELYHGGKPALARRLLQIELASTNKPLKGVTVVEHMCKGFIHTLILESHKQALAELIDTKLDEFTKSRGKGLVTFYRDTILERFGFYEVNDLSKEIKSIVLECEA